MAITAEQLPDGTFRFHGRANDITIQKNKENQKVRFSFGSIGLFLYLEREGKPCFHVGNMVP